MWDPGLYHNWFFLKVNEWKTYKRDNLGNVTTVRQKCSMLINRNKKQQYAHRVVKDLSEDKLLSYGQVASYVKILRKIQKVRRGTILKSV